MRPEVHDPFDDLSDRVGALADRLGLKKPRAWGEVAEEGLLAIEGHQRSILTEYRKGDNTVDAVPTTFEHHDEQHRALFWGEDCVTAFCGYTTFHDDHSRSLDEEAEEKAVVELTDEPLDLDNDDEVCLECRAELLRLREGM